MKKTIVQFYVLSSLYNFFGMSFASAIYVTYLLKNELSLLEVNLVNSIFFLTLFICEIPTGAFADILGRKKSFVLACVLFGLGKIIYGTTNGFWGFALAEIIIAVGSTFNNGAFIAWFVDSMKHHGYDGSLTHIFAKQELIQRVLSSVAAIVGAYFFNWSMYAPWLIGGMAMIGVSVYANKFMSEDYWKPKKFDFCGGLKLMKDITIKSIGYGLNHRAVRVVLIVMFVQILACQALNMYWQPFFSPKGLKEIHFGYFYTGIMMAIALGAFAATKLNVTDKERKWMVVSQIATGFIVIAITFFSGLFSTAVLFLLHEVPRGVINPLKEGYLQKRIPSEERATISSFCSISPHIGGAIGLVVSGFIAQNLSINASWIFSGMIFILGGLLIARNGDPAGK